MSDVFRIKRGELQPVVQYALTYADGTAVPLDTAGTTVKFVMRGPWDSVPEINSPATIENQTTNPGGVSYAWGGSDTANPGVYRAKFVVELGGNPANAESFPTDGYIEIRISDSLTAADERPVYCEESDLLLGDLEFSGRVSKPDYMRRASRDLDVLLATRYVVPIDSTLIPQATKDFLTTVTADMASAGLIMAVAQGGEDNQVNAYGTFLFRRAMAAIKPYLDEELLLEGLTLRSTSRTDSTTGGPVAIKNEDSASLITGFYKTFLDPWSNLPIQNPLSTPYQG